MAIYSCNLRSIGRTTHAPGTAGAYIRYISREGADPVILAAHIPLDPVEARTWMDGRERHMRKNARVIDKIRLAIPRELDPAERAALVQEFMADLTGGKVPWYAAIHQTGKDAHNPHAHIALHDRGIDTGRRVLRLSDNARDREKAGFPGPKAVEWLRERWEQRANAALERAGHEIRIDRRSLDAQGIDRQPGIHEGPGARYVHAHIRRPGSRRRVNGCGRAIDYPAIDRGRLRREFNAHIIDLNLARAVETANPVASAWAGFEKEQFAKDSTLEEQLAAKDRERMAARRALSHEYAEKHRAVLAQARNEARKVQAALQASFKTRREGLRIRHSEQRQELRARHRTLLARAIRTVSRMLKDRQLAERKSQIAKHRAERRQLARQYRQARDEARAEIKSRYQPLLEAIKRKRTEVLTRLRKEHQTAQKDDDSLRQHREADREYARNVLEQKLADMPKDKARPGPQHSDAIARAIEKARRQEASRSGHGKEDEGRTR